MIFQAESNNQQAPVRFLLLENKWVETPRKRYTTHKNGEYADVILNFCKSSQVP